MEEDDEDDEAVSSEKTFKRVEWKDLIGWQLASAQDLNQSPYKSMRSVWADEIYSDTDNLSSDDVSVTVLIFSTRSARGEFSRVVWQASLFNGDDNCIELFEIC